MKRVYKLIIIIIALIGLILFATSCELGFDCNDERNRIYEDYSDRIRDKKVNGYDAQNLIDEMHEALDNYKCD